MNSVIEQSAIVAELEKRLAARGYPGKQASQSEVERFLTVAEAAEVLRCSTGLLYDLLKTGQVPAIRMGAKRYAIPVRAVNLIVDVIMAQGACVSLADWKKAWDAYIAERLEQSGSGSQLKAVAA